MSNALSYARLLDWLQDGRCPDLADLRLRDARPPRGGSSWHTMMITVTVGGGDGTTVRKLVVKRAPDSGPLAPYDVDREVRLLQTLSEQSDVPVPRIVAWSLDRAVLGAPFYVMEFVEGESCDLSAVHRWPTWQKSRLSLGVEMVSMLARIQSFRWQESDLPAILGRPDSSVVQVVGFLNRYLEPALSAARLIGTLDAAWVDLVLWLRENVPPLDADDFVLVHGDFRFGNFIWRDRRIVGVLDWELAMLSDPMLDLGFLCMPLARRRHPELMGMALPFEQLAQEYERMTGRAIDMKRLQFYSIFWQTVHGVLAATSLNVIDRTIWRVDGAAMLLPNLAMRDALRAVDDFERRRHVL
jgi:aminoglycoside phosphotransferase (APT) family kinase protein